MNDRRQGGHLNELLQLDPDSQLFGSKVKVNIPLKIPFHGNNLLQW